MEAVPQDLHSPPNASVAAVHALLGTMPQCPDRMGVHPLRELSHSPFYNLLAEGNAVDKALVLLQSRSKSVGKHMANGWRLQTDGVTDGTDPDSGEQYGAIAYCTFETSPTFTFPAPLRGSDSCIALAVVTKIAAAQKAEHRADLFVEAMEKVEPAGKDAMVRMLQHMQRHGRAAQATADEAAALSPPWEQRKCRRMGRYPTIV